MEETLRKAGYSPDDLTTSIAQNQRSLERFARQYEITSLFSPQARGVFAAMTNQEFGHVIEFLQRSLQVGKESLEFRARRITDQHPNQTRALERPRQIFRRMSPGAQQVASLIILEVWEAAEQSSKLNVANVKGMPY